MHVLVYVQHMYTYIQNVPVYTSCRHVCSCLCTLVKQLTHIGLHLLIPVGERKKAWKHIVVMTGGGFLGVRACWVRWDFIREQKSLALRCRFPDVALSGRLAVPRRTYPHAAALAHLVWSSKGCFVLIIMQCDLGKVVEATLHGKRM